MARPLWPRMSLLVDPLDVMAALAHQLLAGAGEVAELLDGGGRDEARVDESVGEEIGDPGGVVHIALATGDVADLLGVPEQEGGVAFQDVPYRLPVDARGLHGDMGDAVTV